MKFLISNEITIHEPSADVMRYCKSNLILSNPEYTKKQRMNFWIGSTPKEIHYYRSDSGNLIIPYGCLDDLMPIIKQSEWETDFADVPIEHISRNAIILEGYQDTAVNAMHKAKNGILLCPTAGGKTIMGMSLIGMSGQRSLWLVSSQELAMQAASAYTKMYHVEGSDIGFIREGKVELGRKLTIAIINSLYRVDIDKHTFGIIIADECHMAVKSIESSAMFSKCLEMFSCRRKYGVTATFERSDGDEKRVSMLVGNVKREVPREAVSARVVTPSVKRIDTGVESSSEYLDTDGTVCFTSLAKYIAEHVSRNMLIADNVATHMSQGHSCLVLCDRIAQVKMIYDMLLAQEDVADKVCMVTGSMANKKGKAEREAAIEMMRNREKKCLIATVSLAGQGLDIICLSRLHFVSLLKFSGKIAQTVGRVSRAAEGKQAPEVWDYVDSAIGYCLGAYKKRVRTYKKLGMEISG